MQLTDSIRVWVRSLGNECRIRVDGLAKARDLLDRLSLTSALAGLASIKLRTKGAVCTFLVPYSDNRTLASLEIAMSNIAGVRLMLEPEPV